MSFNPLSLFSNGEQGVWYQISDLSTIFQDSAGVTPGVVGQPVGLVLDKSGNGNHLIASGSARPTLRVDGEGYYYLESNGAGNQMVSLVDEPISDKIYLSVKAARGSTATLDGTGIRSAEAVGTRFFLYWSTLNRVSGRVYSPYVSTSLTSGEPPGTPLVWEGMPRNSNGKVEHAAKGNTGVSSEDSSWDGSTSSIQTEITVPQNPSHPENTYSVILVWRHLTAQERADVVDYHTNPPPSSVEVSATQLGRGRVSKLISATRTSTSRISKVLSIANTSSARISKQLDISQYGVANISSKMLSTDLIEITFVDGTIYSVTQDALSRIVNDVPLEQTGMARITRVVSADQPSAGRIQRMFNLMQGSMSRISLLRDMPQIARASIMNQLSKTQAGMAAIQWTLSLTQGSAARISRAFSFVNTAKAQIAKEFSKTIIGRAWLAFIAELTQPSKASIQLVLEKYQTSQAYIGTAYGNVEIGEDEIYAPSSTVEQDYQNTTISGDNIYGVATVEQKQFTKTTISSNNIYEVVEHDGI